MKNPHNPNDMLISPNYRVSHWKNAFESNDWEKMVDIFKDRIEGRFLKPIRLIANDCAIGEFSGFSILALDCLIIETLNQFYLGIPKTPMRRIEDAFVNFFKNSEIFNKNFSDDDISRIFYDHFRCGILHQAQTKGKSVVRIDRSVMIQLVDESDISKGLIINRRLFHDAVEKEITNYIEKLEKGGQENHQLRENFIKKMEFICSINKA
jgi:hypothetical protein